MKFEKLRFIINIFGFLGWVKEKIRNYAQLRPSPIHPEKMDNESLRERERWPEAFIRKSERWLKQTLISSYRLLWSPPSIKNEAHTSSRIWNRTDWLKQIYIYMEDLGSQHRVTWYRSPIKETSGKEASLGTN